MDSSEIQFFINVVMYHGKTSCFLPYSNIKILDHSLCKQFKYIIDRFCCQTCKGYTAKYYSQ